MNEGDPCCSTENNKEGGDVEKNSQRAAIKNCQQHQAESGDHPYDCR